MPIQHLGTTPAQSSPLTQMLQGLAGGLQTGMGGLQQKKQLQYQQSVLDFEMEKWSSEDTFKTMETMYGMATGSTPEIKTYFETKVKENPVFLGQMEDYGFWHGGPEGGFTILAESKKTDYQLSKYGDDYILWDKLNPEDREVLEPEKAKETKLVEGEEGYFQYTEEGVPVGTPFHVGAEVDPSNIKEFTHKGVTVIYDMTDPSKPIRLAQIEVPTAEPTAVDKQKEHYERIKDAKARALARIRVPYESMMLVEDDKVREGLIGRLETDYRRYLKEELIVGNISEAEATKIAGGAPLPPSIGIVANAWADADTGERARIEWFVKNTPDLLAQAEARPEIWDVEEGAFIIPAEEKGILERLLVPAPKGERPIDKWHGLDEVEFGEGVPAKAPAEEPTPAAIPKEGVLYTPEIDEAVAEAKKDSGDIGKMEALQMFLKDKGYWDYSITGKWTATLETALREFYRDYVKKE